MHSHPETTLSPPRAIVPLLRKDRRDCGQDPGLWKDRRDYGQDPGRDNAAVPWNTRSVSLCTNTEKALLPSSSNTPCTHPEKTIGQRPPCSSSIAWSQLALNHAQSFFWPSERPTLRRTRRSSTSQPNEGFCLWCLLHSPYHRQMIPKCKF